VPPCHSGTAVAVPLILTVAVIGVLGVATVLMLQGIRNLKLEASVTVGVLSKNRFIVPFCVFVVTLVTRYVWQLQLQLQLHIFISFHSLQRGEGQKPLKILNNWVAVAIII
jgi:hypothetical protein